MAPPPAHLRLLAPPLRLLLGAMWRVARQQAREHYGMLEELITAATEKVPELLSINEKTELLLALRTKEVSGQDFGAALETLLHHFLSRLQLQLPVPDFTKVSALLDDDWLSECLQEVRSQDLKELLTNDSAALNPPHSGLTNDSAAPNSDVVLKPEAVLKSARQQLSNLQTTHHSKPTNQGQDHLRTANETQTPTGATNQSAALPTPQPATANQGQDHLRTANETQAPTGATNQSMALPTPQPATANQATALSLLNFLHNQTTLLLIPANQSAGHKPTNEGTAEDSTANEDAAEDSTANEDTAEDSAANEDAAEDFSANQRASPAVSASVPEPTNEEPCLDPPGGSDQSQAASAEAPPTVSQNARRLAHKCPQCSKAFIYRNQVVRHLETNRSCGSALGPALRPITSLQCFQCPAAFESEAELADHLRTHRPGSKTRTGTGTQTRTRTQTQTQTQTGPGPGPGPDHSAQSQQQRAPSHTQQGAAAFACSLCDQSFRRQNQLLSHLDGHVIRGDTPTFSCVHCEEGFTDSTLLRLHQRVHELRPFSCEQCGKWFRSPQTLAQHSKVHARQRGFLCHTCGRSFSTAGSLKTHAHVHSDRAPLACPLCGRGFRFRSALRVHLRRHLGVKPYACAECGKSFSSSGDLGPHMRTHTGEKPYSCRECGQRFTVSSHLRSHLRKHTGEKPHSCPDCGKRFFSKTSLEQHKQVTHLHQRNYSCELCAKAYTCRNHLRRHQKTHQNKV